MATISASNLNTLTAENFADTSLVHAVDAVAALLCAPKGFVGIKPTLVDAAEELKHFGDKPLNVLAGVIKSQIMDAAWYLAAPTEALAFVSAFKSKAKLDDRRSLLASWFAVEAEATNAIEQRIDGEAAAAKQRIADEKAAKKAARDSARAAKSPPADPVTAAILASGDAPVVTITSDAAATAKPERKPAEPKAPRDRFDGMNIAQLLTAVQAMFGHGTTMTNESALRYKLRRGEKMMLAGQRPVFSVSTPSAPRVKLTHERAKQAIEMLKVAEALGHGMAGMIISEIEEQLKASTSTDTVTTSAAA